jgi:hypothetical protein
MEHRYDKRAEELTNLRLALATLALQLDAFEALPDKDERRTDEAVSPDKNWYFGARLVTDQSFSFQPLNGTQESAAASPRQRLVNASYLLAIATATFGWLWLIVWCAMELI